MGEVSLIDVCKRFALRIDGHAQTVRALDRLLISGFYIVPFYYAPEQWIAYSSKLGHPDETPLFGVDLSTWWRREK